MNPQQDYVAMAQRIYNTKSKFLRALTQQNPSEASKLKQELDGQEKRLEDYRKQQGLQNEQMSY